MAGVLRMFGFGEISAAQQLDAHRFEVVAAGEGDCQGILGRVFCGNGLRREAGYEGPLVQRKVLHDADRLDAGQAPQPLHEGEVKSRPRHSVCQLVLLGRELEREDVLRDVAGVDVAELREAAQQQPGADQEQERERRLRHDETVPRPPPAVRRAARTVAQPGEADAGRPQRGHDTARKPGHRADAEGEEHRRQRKLRAAQARHRNWRIRNDHGDQQRGHPDGERAGDDPHDAGLDELAADEPAALRPDRMTDGDVAPLSFGAAQEKIGHVGASDHEQDRHRAEQDPQRLCERSEQILLERHHSGDEPLDDFGVRGRATVFFRQPARDQIELRDQRLAIHAGSNPRNDTGARTGPV